MCLEKIVYKGVDHIKLTEDSVAAFVHTVMNIFFQ
jgi:hypothetical protein